MVSQKELEEKINKLSQNDPSLTELNLRDSRIGYIQAGKLANALRKNTKLKSLDVKNNNLGHKGAMAILASALKKNSTLTHLCISNNSLGDVAAHALASLLKEKNNTLVELNLSCNSIGDEGATELASALKMNTTLKNLNLKSNEIGNGGARALTRALTRTSGDYNTTITRLNLDKNEKVYTRINNTLDDLDKLLERNQKLEREKAPWLSSSWLPGFPRIFAAAAKTEAKGQAEKQKVAKTPITASSISSLRKQWEAEEKVKESERTNDEPVPIIPPTECKIMVSFNDFSAGEDAEKLANYLTGKGHPTFCTRLYCPGMAGSWREETRNGVISCKYYVLLLTNGWQKSKECQFETNIAINRLARQELTFIPVWYEDFDKDFDRKGKNYDIQFQDIQSIYRKSSTWMESVLKQLGGEVGVNKIKVEVEKNPMEIKEKHLVGRVLEALDRRREFAIQMLCLGILILAVTLKFFFENEEPVKNEFSIPNFLKRDLKKSF